LVRPAARQGAAGEKKTTSQGKGRGRSSRAAVKEGPKISKTKHVDQRQPTEKKYNKLLAQFQKLANAACQSDHRLSSDPAVGRQLRAYRQRLMTLAKGHNAYMKGQDAVAASISLVLYTEALANQGNQRDVEVLMEAAMLRKNFIAAHGVGRWDQERVDSRQLIDALLGAAEPPLQVAWTEQAALRRARQLSVLHRLVSLAAGAKNDCASRELSAMSIATVKAVCVADPGGCCSICLGEWAAQGAQSPVIVLSCGHVFHVDCFWRIIRSTQSGLRGQCRICRALVSWGPLARGNLRCTLAAAAASEGEATFEVAEAIASEIGEKMDVVCRELESELLRRRGPSNL